ncbi:MAG: DNA-directed RNA polymerase subunit K [Candidatus Pacearchaeota archaeon]
MTEKTKFSKYERARIIGARALQVSMDAPILIKLKKEELEDINYDPLKIAEKELDNGILPISVNRPMPRKKKEDIEKIKIEDSASENDEEKTKVEEREEKEIIEKGEMMELTNTEEDIEESVSEEAELEDVE